MLVDYVRVYQFEGQSVEVAEQSETAIDNSVDSATAVSVAIALGVLVGLCLVSCRRFRGRVGEALEGSSRRSVTWGAWAFDTRGTAEFMA